MEPAGMTRPWYYPNSRSQFYPDGVPIHILDGGLGSTLADMFHTQLDPLVHPIWTAHLLLSDPKKLFECHKAFVNASADFITTATTRISRNGFADSRIEGEDADAAPGDVLRDDYGELGPETFPNGVPHTEIPRIVAKAVRIAFLAAQSSPSLWPSPNILLSLGSCGSCVAGYHAPYNDVPGIQAWHSDRLGLLQTVEGLDKIRAIAFETIPVLDEVIAIRKAMAREGAPQYPFWISCMFAAGTDEAPSLLDNSKPEEVVQRMLESTPGLGTLPYAIGINCTSIGRIQELIIRYEAAVEKMATAGEIRRWPSLVVYPQGQGGKMFDPETLAWGVKNRANGFEEGWAERLCQIIQATVARRKPWSSIIVGGCCDSSPYDIASLREGIMTMTR